jgi:outer membrane immunogenic protein
MKKLLISSVGLLATLTLVGPAIAADLKAEPRRERATQSQTQQSSNWNGSQVGGSNGASSVNNNFVEPGAHLFTNCGFPSTFCQETPFSFSGHKTSYIAGVFAGYRWQMGNIVFGVEGDVNFKRGETSQVQNSPSLVSPFPGYEQFTGSQKQGTDGSFRGRIGFLVTPWTLIYATGGLAVGNVSGSFSYLACSAASCNPLTSTNVYGTASWSDTRVGGTVGAGAETQIAGGVKARLEYRYTDFGSYSKDVPLANNSPGCPPAQCGTNAHIDLRANNHRLMVGLGFDLSGL